MQKTAWKLDNKQLRYSNIGSKITNMLQFTSQSIAGSFPASQGLWNTPSQVCNVAACGWAYRPSYTLRCYTRAMGRSKAPAMYQNPMRCSAMHFPTCGNFLPDYGISQLYIFRFSNGFQQNDGHYHRIHDHRRR